MKKLTMFSLVVLLQVVYSVEVCPADLGAQACNHVNMLAKEIKNNPDKGMGLALISLFIGSGKRPILSHFRTGIRTLAAELVSETGLDKSIEEHIKDIFFKNSVVRKGQLITTSLVAKFAINHPVWDDIVADIIYYQINHERFYEVAGKVFAQQNHTATQEMKRALIEFVKSDEGKVAITNLVKHKLKLFYALEHKRSILEALGRNGSRVATICIEVMEKVLSEVAKREPDFLRHLVRKVISSGGVAIAGSRAAFATARAVGGGAVAGAAVSVAVAGASDALFTITPWGSQAEAYTIAQGEQDYAQHPYELVKMGPERACYILSKPANSNVAKAVLELGRSYYSHNKLNEDGAAGESIPNSDVYIYAPPTANRTQ